jgi:SAM-dependent methyltransferase
LKCKFCSSMEILVQQKIRSPFNHLVYHLYKCQACQSAFFQHDEHKTDINSLYQSIASESKYSKQPVFKADRNWQRQKKRIIKLLGKKPDNVLDIGCRTGDFLLHFEPATDREGVEVSKKYATIARQRGLKIYNDFLENIPFSSHYDVVSCYAILEHLVNPVAFLNKLGNLVNKDGLLVILVPSYQCLKVNIINMLNKRWHMYNPPEHLNFFSTTYLDQVLKKENFRLLKRYYTSGGMINPFKQGTLKKIFSSMIYFWDEYSFMHKIPIFDHMYSYYKNS